jgi:nitrite reductase (NADH) small subunit
MSWVATGVAVETVPVGAVREVTAAGRSVLLVRTADGVFAVDAYCPHEGGVLADGWVEGRRLSCPVHQAVFDAVDGHVVADPFGIEPPQGGVGALRHFPTRVAAGMVEVDLTDGTP